MKIFTNVYEKIIELSYKKSATRCLYFISFLESFIFPVPPDVLLAPIALTKQYNWFKLAFYTTVSSVIGGLVGYILGVYLYEISLLSNIISEEVFIKVKNLFLEHGVIIMVIAGFTPLPFKAFTIIAGYMALALIPFILSSFIGRGLRFFLVSALFNYFGIERANKLKKYFEYIGLIFTFILLILIYYKFF